MRPRTLVRGHVGWLVSRSVGFLVMQTFEMYKTADSDVFHYSYHLSYLTTFIFIHSFVHSFIKNIHSSKTFIYQKTFIHKFLIKRGALIGLHLALFLSFKMRISFLICNFLKGLRIKLMLKHKLISYQHSISKCSQVRRNRGRWKRNSGFAWFPQIKRLL